MATLKNLLDNGLKVGALVKIDGELHQFHGISSQKHIERKHYYMFLSIITGITFDIFADNVSLKFELTTAYDCGIAADALPIHEPVDVTGWVVDSEGYKHQIEHLHAGDVNYSSGFDEETEMQPDYFEFTNGGHAFVYECRACLPPH